MLKTISQNGRIIGYLKIKNMNFKISNKIKIAFPALMIFALIFSVIGISFVEAAPVEVTPVSVQRISAPAIFSGNGESITPVFIRSSVSSSIRPSVKASNKAETIVPIGRFDEDAKEDNSDSVTTNANCAYVDFNRDGDIDTRDMLAYLNVWATEDISADMNGDGVVDTNDYNMFTSSWKICYSPECLTADFNGDQVIDTRDVLAFLNAWSSRDESADVNGDGRVSGMDISTFFSTWRKCNV